MRCVDRLWENKHISLRVIKDVCYSGKSKAANVYMLHSTLAWGVQPQL